MNLYKFYDKPKELINWNKNDPENIGKIEFKKDGKLHRKDGPAIERADGDKYWYLNGQRHREDGPAVELVNGTKYWYLNGQRHREDGPAVEYTDGDKFWYFNGKDYSENDYKEKIK